MAKWESQCMFFVVCVMYGGHFQSILKHVIRTLGVEGVLGVGGGV